MKTFWSQRVPESPEDKAMQLLLRHLTPEQQEQLRAFGYFDTLAGIGLVVRIHNVRHGFVELVGHGFWCVYSVDERVPVADETLAKKLYWEAHADTFELARVGNWSPR